jgi:hypothetical protein
VANQLAVAERADAASSGGVGAADRGVERSALFAGEDGRLTDDELGAPLAEVAAFEGRKGVRQVAGERERRSDVTRSTRR